MLRHTLFVVACCITQMTFAGENRPTDDEIAKLTARIEQLEKRIVELERQNAGQPSVTLAPQYQPYHAPQYPTPRPQPYIPNTNPTPNYNSPYTQPPQYVPQTPPAVPYQPQRVPNEAVPETWKPFDFNGMRYYIIPLDEAQRINPLNQNDRTKP